jgi:hypothetical protein
MTKWITTLGALVALTSGCAASEPYDPDWSSDPLAAGKADGIWDIIPELVVGGDGKVGYAAGEQLDLYKVELQTQDRIRLTMTVTDGDLEPHISVYRGTSAYVSSDEWEREGATLTKDYTAPSAGLYLVAARAFRGRGAGAFTIAVGCLGGPCNGEFVEPEPEEITATDAASCVEDARRCAFSRLDRYDGAVGEVRAQALWDECMGEASVSGGLSCASMCDVHEDVRALCNEIRDALVFYADQPPACLAELDGCLSSCYGEGGGDPDDLDDFWVTAESICWTSGLNGNCDAYARDHAACGGTRYRSGSAMECFESCASTVGAWIDDLDTLCDWDIGCSDACEEYEIADAAAACGGLDVSSSDCMYEYMRTHDLWICDEELQQVLHDLGT